MTDNARVLDNNNKSRSSPSTDKMSPQATPKQYNSARALDKNKSITVVLTLSSQVTTTARKYAETEIHLCLLESKHAPTLLQFCIISC
jgi:hypothetical protein